MTPMISPFVRSHADWVLSYLNRGFAPTFATVMFNPLPGNENTKRKLMQETVETLYTRYLKRCFRRPGKIALTEMPLWVFSFDRPVPKKEKFDRDHFVNIAINDGLHMHGICLTPPKTRVKVSLDVHFYDEHDYYFGRPSPAHRMLWDPIVKTPEYVVGYALKSISRGYFDVGSVVILPRAHSEFQRVPEGQTPRDLVIQRIFQRKLWG